MTSYIVDNNYKPSSLPEHIPQKHDHKTKPKYWHLECTTICICFREGHIDSTNEGHNMHIHVCIFGMLLILVLSQINSKIIRKVFTFKKKM